MSKKRTAEAVLEPPGEADSAFAWLSVDQLRPADDNPRRTMAMDELDELTTSVRAQGILEPLLVRPVGGEAAVTGHDEVLTLVGLAADRTHEQRLQDALGADAGGQLVQLVHGHGPARVVVGRAQLVDG